MDSNAVHKEKDMESLAAFENEDTAAIPDGNGDKSKSQVCAEYLLSNDAEYACALKYGIPK